MTTFVGSESSSRNSKSLIGSPPLLKVCSIVYVYIIQKFKFKFNFFRRFDETL